MNEPNEPDLANQGVGPPVKRNLSILDLMLAMAAFALALGGQQNLEPMLLVLNPKDSFWGAVFYVSPVVFKGLTFWGLMLLVQSRFNATKQLVLHPGHLMLVMVFFDMAASTLRVWLWGMENPVPGQANIIFFIAVQLIAFCIALAGALTWRWSWLWVRTWVLLSLSSFLNLGSYCLMLAIANSVLSQEFFSVLAAIGLVSSNLPLLVALFVVIAIVVDLRKGTSRDAAHWIGIVCWFGLSIFATVLLRVALLFV